MLYIRTNAVHVLPTDANGKMYVDTGGLSDVDDDDEAEN
jgi:hypothetical protein